MQETTSVVIVAAGSSRSMGHDKLWLPLAGRITLAHTINAFQSSPLIDKIILVTSTERQADTRALCQKEQWHKVAAVVVGGPRRQDSVCIGLDTLATLSPSCLWVMI